MDQNRSKLVSPERRHSRQQDRRRHLQGRNDRKNSQEESKLKPSGAIGLISLPNCPLSRAALRRPTLRQRTPFCRQSRKILLARLEGSRLLASAPLKSIANHSTGITTPATPTATFWLMP